MSMYVITHKHFNYQKLPVEYTPILVGANKNSNPDHFVQDNEGDNISDKNFSYCELTGLYWMWKHSKSQNIGLSHYRRYFANYESRKVMYLHELVYGEVKPIGLRLSRNMGGLGLSGNNLIVIIILLIWRFWKGLSITNFMIIIILLKR